ncbi:LytTR family transcriptional regulator [Draconibacterium sp.]|nr:LytTR family transcriptional regulator [Draconibacterium sp.]
MKSKISNPYFHIIYWIIVIIIFTVVFGRSWGSGLQAFYFISLLLPVVMGTSYFFNYYLVPGFLLMRKYFWFALYFFYTLVISLYLEMLVLTFSFIYLANFELEQMGPNSSDTLLLAIVMYLVIFLGSFLLMVQQLLENRQELEALKTEKKKMEKPFLELVSNRKSVRILYENIVFIESLTDYIRVHTTRQEEIRSKEKISVLEEKLPDSFIRIHRSFIINRVKVTRFNTIEVELGEIVLPIGRSYKKQVLIKLKS